MTKLEPSTQLFLTWVLIFCLVDQKCHQWLFFLTKTSLYKPRMCLCHRCCLQWLLTGASTIQITARRGCHYLNKFLSTVNVAMATAFKLFILEKSVFSKCFLELNFQAKEVISRVPCTAVFLRLHASGFQYWIF